LLQEAVDPFLSDLKRQMKLGLEMEALEICKGILLGLYRIRDTRSDELLGWAEDFPAEAAADAVRVLAGGKQQVASGPRRARPHLGEEFVDKHLPEWSDLIARALEQGSPAKASSNRPGAERSTGEGRSGVANRGSTGRAGRSMERPASQGSILRSLAVPGWRAASRGSCAPSPAAAAEPTTRRERSL
jgi:hypothetical protein